MPRPGRSETPIGRIPKLTVWAALERVQQSPRLCGASGPWTHAVDLDKRGVLVRRQRLDEAFHRLRR
jgi:hypothetical protein